MAQNNISLGLSMPWTATPAVPVTRSEVLALSPTIFFDVSDLTSLFVERVGPTTQPAVGDPVGTMLDLSGNARHAVAGSDAARPILRQDGGGRYYLEFDGTDDYMDLAAALNLFQNSNAGTMSVSAAPRSTISATETMWFWTTGSGATRALIQHSSAALPVAAGRRLDADSSQNVTGTTAAVANSPKVIWGEFDWANAAARMYVNNVLEGNNTSFQTAGSTSNTTSTICRLGSAGGTGFSDMNFYGGVARAFIWSAANRTTVARYLGQLAGLTLS